MKKILLIISVLLLSVCIFASCKSAEGASGSGGTETTSTTAEMNGNVRLTFAESIDLKRIKELSGKTVEIVGYMATVSPVSGRYIYLMNLPYQSCPYCVPNTQQLSNTIAVYAKENDKFKFYDGPINVTGTLETGDFEDEYGYTYGYRIANATYSRIDSAEASEKLALWEKISDKGIASDVYSMFDYVDFECNWPNYRGKDKEGNYFYLYPADVPYFEKNQFGTQCASDFFTGLASRAEAIGDSRMNELIKILKDGEALANEAVAERTAKNYTYDKEKDKYTLTNGEDLMKKARDLYSRYAVWLEIFSLSK